jgi:hypothetical protein
MLWTFRASTGDDDAPETIVGACTAGDDAAELR